jgi:hypothetical protein
MDVIRARYGGVLGGSVLVELLRGGQEGVGGEKMGLDEGADKASKVLDAFFTTRCISGMIVLKITELFDGRQKESEGVYADAGIGGKPGFGEGTLWVGGRFLLFPFDDVDGGGGEDVALGAVDVGEGEGGEEVKRTVGGLGSEACVIALEALGGLEEAEGRRFGFDALELLVKEFAIQGAMGRRLSPEGIGLAHEGAEGSMDPVGIGTGLEGFEGVGHEGDDDGMNMGRLGGDLVGRPEVTDKGVFQEDQALRGVPAMAVGEDGAEEAEVSVELDVPAADGDPVIVGQGMVEVFDAGDEVGGVWALEGDVDVTGELGTADDGEGVLFEAEVGRWESNALYGGLLL